MIRDTECIVQNKEVMVSQGENILPEAAKFKLC